MLVEELLIFKFNFNHFLNCLRNILLIDNATVMTRVLFVLRLLGQNDLGKQTKYVTKKDNLKSSRRNRGPGNRIFRSF